tara:strand:- start:2 stop:436 length:435 start_codon:yes stop_codon:yes gene_type:complete
MKLTQIQKIVESYYNIKIDAKDRRAHFVHARMIYFNLCKVFGDEMGLVEIGRSIGKDHSTVYYMYNRLLNFLQIKDRQTLEDYTKLYNLCKKFNKNVRYDIRDHIKTINRLVYLEDTNKTLRVVNKNLRRENDIMNLKLKLVKN